MDYPALVGVSRDLPPLSTQTSHQVWLCNPQGYRVALISNYVSLKYTLGIKGGGQITLDLPPNYDTRYLKMYSYLEVWRKVGEQLPSLEDVFVVQSMPQTQTRRGSRFITLAGPTATDFFLGKNSRVINALDTATGASYTDNTDDLLRQYVFNNLGDGAGNSGTSEGRDLSTYAGMTIENMRNIGPSITENVFLRPLDDVLAEIAKKSEEDTTKPLRLFWYMLPKSFNPLRFEFRVFYKYYGRYRGFSSPNPLIFSPMLSNVGHVELDWDYREAWNSVFIAYNTKTATTRITSTTRRGIAPQGFREVFYDAGSGWVVGTAQAEASGKLNDGKERNLTRIQVAPSAVSRYGAEYRLGDVVGTVLLGRRADMEISGVEVSRTAEGEDINLRFDAV